MKGMLDKATEAQPQPTNEVPPEGQTPGIDEEALKPQLDQAIQLIYGDNFEGLVKMFAAGPEAFPNAMSTAVNKVLEKLEAAAGDMAPETATYLGGQIFQMLTEDLVTGGVLPELDPALVVEGIQQTMMGWLKSHQDQVDPNEAGQSIREFAAALQEGGVLDDQPIEGQAGPEPMPEEGMV